MNLAIRGIDFNLGKEPADSFVRDQHPDLRADFVRQQHRNIAIVKTSHFKLVDNTFQLVVSLRDTKYRFVHDILLQLITGLFLLQVGHQP
jgi:hypothetical protein